MDGLLKHANKSQEMTLFPYTAFMHAVGLLERRARQRWWSVLKHEGAHC